jgi:hypothetical protein
MRLEQFTSGPPGSDAALRATMAYIVHLEREREDAALIAAASAPVPDATIPSECRTEPGDGDQVTLVWGFLGSVFAFCIALAVIGLRFCSTGVVNSS